ncbi:hypothetical protein [Pelosinus propionicus]|uniref:Uncharacterized protein n=1 Tax=Pelosinus propionicus DSM 13327 TaxID=1123291 RepID=A0A1I4Q4V9_9FIRM|nr:hypothetical protein [Pelosinus propionicus]SFM34690.1 hypothetical protein SAMN04490355_108214 [Pelosinus propionicus DSM 13327]
MIVVVLKFNWLGENRNLDFLEARLISVRRNQRRGKRNIMLRIQALFSSGSTKILSRGKVILEIVIKLVELVQKVFDLIDKLS